MAKKPRVVGLPLNYELGRELKNGQDNTVYTLVEPHIPPHQREMSIGLVAKVNHARRNVHNAHVEAHEDPKEAAMRGILYKKNVYEIMRTVMGDYIPDSHFVLAEAEQGRGGEKRYVELTLQRDIGRTTLQSMPEGVRSQRLQVNTSRLLVRAGVMLAATELSNNEVEPEQRIPLRVDVGISDLVMHGPNECNDLARNVRTPNILVSHNDEVSYVDFGQGQWHDGLNETRDRILEYAQLL